MQQMRQMRPSELVIAAVLIAIGALLSLRPRTASVARQRPWIVPFVLRALLQRFWIYLRIGVPLLCGAIVKAWSCWRARNNHGKG